MVFNSLPSPKRRPSGKSIFIPNVSRNSTAMRLRVESTHHKSLHS